MMSEVKRLTPYLGANHDRLMGQSYITHHDHAHDNVTVSFNNIMSVASIIYSLEFLQWSTFTGLA